VAGRTRHLHADDADEPVVGGQLRGLDAGVDLVVVRDGERVEADRGRLLQEELDRVTPVVGQLGVGMQLDR